MGKKLYVGNLGYGLRDKDLEKIFSQYGTVVSATVILQQDTGRSKGFGFVEMNTDEEALAAINGLNGQEIEGRPLTVNERRPQPAGGGDRRGGGGGRRGGFGGGDRDRGDRGGDRRRY